MGYWLSDCALYRLRIRQAVVIGGGVAGRGGAGSTMGGAAGGLVRAGCDSYRQKKAPVKGLRGWGCGYSMINADPNTSPIKNVEPIKASSIPLSSSSRHPSSFICSAPSYSHKAGKWCHRPLIATDRDRGLCHHQR